MNYKDLQNIAHLSQEILSESASDNHDPMNRWPYTSPYLQESVEDIDEARDGYGDDSKFKQDTDAASFRPGKDVPKVKKYGRISRAVPYGIGAHATRTVSNVTKIVGEDPGAPRAVKMAREKKSEKKESSGKKMVKKDGKWVKEGYDLFDLVLEHLVNEGFAETPEAAIAIMSNMSEAWVDSIVDYYIEG
jgi:hypothetical protein